MEDKVSSCLLRKPELIGHSHSDCPQVEGRGSIQGNQVQQGGPSGREREESLQALGQKKQVPAPGSPGAAGMAPQGPNLKVL